VTTVEFDLRPLHRTTLPPVKTPLTRCPPVTFVYEVFLSSVGANAGTLVKAVDGNTPFSTWYVSKAVTISGLVAADVPAVLLRNFARAALLGARRVMFVAEPRELTRAGCVPKSPFSCVSY
jgi:hypothetical protein